MLIRVVGQVWLRKASSDAVKIKFLIFQRNVRRGGSTDRRLIKILHHSDFVMTSKVLEIPPRDPNSRDLVVLLGALRVI